MNYVALFTSHKRVKEKKTSVYWNRESFKGRMEDNTIKDPYNINIIVF